MVADAYVACEGCAATMCDRDGESLCALSGGNDAAVAVGLFNEMLVSVYPHPFIPMQFLIPLHWCEIGCGEDTSTHVGFLLFVIRFSPFAVAAKSEPRTALLDIVNEAEEAAPSIFGAYGLGIDREPDEDGLAHDMVFWHEAPVSGV